jgi:hypothetical protein
MKSRLLRVALLALAAAPAAGQEVPVGPLPIVEGSKLRLTQMSGNTIRGILAGMGDRSLVIAQPVENPLVPPPRFEVPLASLERVEVSQGQRSSLWLGALVGAVAIGALGFAMDVNPDDCGDDSSAFCSRAEAVAVTAGTGAVLGGLVGFFIKRERWVPVAVEALGAPAEVGRRPEPVPLMAGVSFRF